MEGTPDDRYSHLRTVFGNELFEKIRTSSVLVVGAGGIGCELLKNLVLTGFANIEIIDLDTIDLSNLNRQFLFNRNHVGQSKAKVARESVLRFDPSASIVAHQADVKTPAYGVEFFSRFDLVLNALDNVDARRHVNRLCVATGRPLIESGTAGYLGQVQVIVPTKTECYECQPKQPPKTYASCTIRSSPKEPVHCVIWAKANAFSTYFGDPAAVVQDDETIDDDRIRAEEATLQEIKRTRGFARWLFHKLFYFDIFVKLRVAELTKLDIFMGRAPPTPLRLEDAQRAGGAEPAATAGRLPEQVLHSLARTADVFLETAAALRRRADETGHLDFEKDDREIMGFVAAASNLRMHVFDIPRQTEFDIKSLAGNIIPAIATTNAVVAGLIVMQATNVLRSRLDLCRSVWLTRGASRGRVLSAINLDQPNPACFVCSAKNAIAVKVNTETSVLSWFVDQVLKKALGFNQPYISVGSSEIYASGETLDKVEAARFAKQSTRILKDVKLVNGAVATIDDESQELKVSLTILHGVFGPEDRQYELLGSISVEAKPLAAAEPPATVSAAAAETAVDDEVVLVEAGPPRGVKRKAAPDLELSEGPRARKAKH